MYVCGGTTKYFWILSSIWVDDEVECHFNSLAASSPECARHMREKREGQERETIKGRTNLRFVVDAKQIHVPI